MRFIVITLHAEALISLFADISLNCVNQDVILVIHTKKYAKIIIWEVNKIAQ